MLRMIKIINILGDRFGYTVNKKGYKVLDPHIRIIQGDGVNYEVIKEVLETLKNAKWATENLAFGSGGALLQKLDRDTQKFAFKCSLAIIDGEEVEVYKNPITDPGKISKKGRLALRYHKESREWETLQGVPLGFESELETVFENGRLVRDMNFDDVRTNAKI